ncbi:MAG: hypothetical protein M1402_01190 [Candidatus Thermoplasmatota archaeon]|nr:hypothetical protein [Candidatus Thermoplasmatota archaeon]
MVYVRKDLLVTALVIFALGTFIFFLPNTSTGITTQSYFHELGDSNVYSWSLIYLPKYDTITISIDGNEPITAGFISEQNCVNVSLYNDKPQFISSYTGGYGSATLKGGSTGVYAAIVYELPPGSPPPIFTMQVHTVEKYAFVGYAMLIYLVSSIFLILSLLWKHIISFSSRKSKI